jgi:hypothetical protein
MRQASLSYLVLIVPLLVSSSLLAADSKAAIICANGVAWINGASVPRSSSTIFSGDLLLTRSDSVANINQPGSILTVWPDSLVRFEYSSLNLEHGRVTIATSSGVAVVAGDVKIAPVSDAWTEFNVVDVDGTVRVLARKGEITVADRTRTVTLLQGQEISRDQSSDANNAPEERKRKSRSAGAPPSATGGIMSSPYAIATGAAVISGVSTWVLIHSDDPVSPAVP